MARFSFDLTNLDTARLFAIKEIQGENDVTGNEFARKLLERELHRLFPNDPLFDDDGKVVNADMYRE